MYSGAGQSFGAAGTPGQGTRGGNSPTVNNDYYAGGGGGASSHTEVDAVNGTRAGNGGNGISTNIMGASFFFGGKHIFLRKFFELVVNAIKQTGWFHTASI
jgi:hypothetical protein